MASNNQEAEAAGAASGVSTAEVEVEAFVRENVSTSRPPSPLSGEDRMSAIEALLFAFDINDDAADNSTADAKAQRKL